MRKCRCGGTEFYKDKSRSDGFSAYCKKCMNKKYMKYYNKKRENGGNPKG